jgi:putative ABC transport system substrate-binding protein
MKRREFIAVVGGAAAWPVVATGEATAPVIGYLTSLSRNDRPILLDAFRRGLSEVGYVEGRNISIEYRYAENRPDRLPTLAADLVSRKVSLIAATAGSVPSAKAATTAIPIVFTTGGDPVQEGYVASLNRPGGNVTGVSWFTALVTGKALALVHELSPQTSELALLVSPSLRETARISQDADEAARTLGLKVLTLLADTPLEIDAAFAALRQRNLTTIVIGGGPFFTARRQQIVALASQESVLAMYSNREFVEDGGLICYGNNIAKAYQRAGAYAGRILHGAQAADLPVDRATDFELVINLRTARALGLTVPPTLLARADEVIE